MNIASKQQFMPIPYDAEVEWLASSGGALGSPAIVIPNFVLTRPYEIVAEWEMTKVAHSYNRFVTLMGGASGGEVLLRNSNKLNVLDFTVYKGSITFAIFSISQPHSRNTLTTTASSNAVTVHVNDGDQTKTFNASLIPYGPQYLILWKGTYVNSDSEFAAGRIYYVRIKCANEVKLELKPVRKDGIGYFYDTVSNKLFGNTEEGAVPFEIGPDKASQEIK